MVQLDNGGKFGGVFYELLLKEYIEITYGRAKHPQSQGSVEQGNRVFKIKLATWQEQFITTGWVSALSFHVLVLNKQLHSALLNNLCPYKVTISAKAALGAKCPS